MRELIDRESVLDCFHSWVDKRGDMHTPDEMEEYNAIEALPTIEVVRCKDCKEYYLPFNHEQVEQVWTCMRYGLLRNADDFCSRGERREE